MLTLQLGIYGAVEHFLIFLVTQDLLRLVEVHIPEFPHERKDVAALTGSIVIP